MAKTATISRNIATQPEPGDVISNYSRTHLPGEDALKKRKVVAVSPSHVIYENDLGHRFEMTRLAWVAMVEQSIEETDRQIKELQL